MILFRYIVLGFIARLVNAKQLIFVHALWRHGTRSPLEFYPSTPYKEDFWIPGPGGELTPLGMDEHVKLGQKLKQRFMIENKLVSRRYKSKEIYIRSSGTNRAIVSAMANMVGFYFAEGFAGMDYPYNWQWPSYWTPIPVHSEPWGTDSLMNRRACPLARDYQTLAEQTPEFQEFENVSQPLVKFLSKHAGKIVTNSSNAPMVCDVIITEDSNNLLLTWQKGILPQCKEYIAELYNFRFGWNMAPFKGHNMRTEIPTVIGGRLLWEIITRMQQKYENFLDPSKYPEIKDLKYYAYSAHDMVLAVFSAMMDFQYIDFDRNVAPGPANAYTIELWLNDDMEPYVKVLYWRKENPSFIDVSRNISGCKFTVDGCSLDHFAKRSDKYRPPENFDEYCNTRLTDI